MKKRSRSALLRAAFTLPLCAALMFWLLWSAPAAAGNYDITGPVNGNVYGNGDPNYLTASDVGTATNNSLTIKNGGEVDGDVFGGQVRMNSDPTMASGNSATVESGGVAKKFLYGGSARSGSGSTTASGNSATVAAGGEAGNIRSGYAHTEDGSGSATAQDNQVIVEDNTLITGYITGGHAIANGTGDALASGNTVTIGGGTTSGNAFIYGATAYSGSGTALAKGNTVTINGGDFRSISIIVGGSSTGGNAEGNDVLISGGTFFNELQIYGGLGNATGDDATGNNVIISGGTFDEAFISGAFASGGSATGNSVTLAGTPYLTTSSIYGGNFNGNSPGDVFGGNILNVKTSGLTVATIGNFEHLNFYLPATLEAGGAMLTVTKSAYLTEYTDGAGRSSQIQVGIDGASSPLQIGDRVTLIDASNATGDRLVANSGLNTTTQGEGMAGVTLKYEFDIAADTAAGLLTATVTNVGADEQAKALVEGVMGGVSLVTQGGDIVAGEAMANAVSAAGGVSTVAGFGAASGGSVRLNSGSHVDMHSVSLVAGLAWGKDFTPGRMTIGAFFEYGTGSYDTYNSFSSAASVHGKGDTYYWGGGILGRMDFTNTGPGHFYTEGSLRMGRLYNEYKNDDLRDSLGRKTSYDTDSLYYSLHLGSGYVWNVTQASYLDLYGKYFWTRQEGDSVKLSTGDSVSFKDVDSHRLRGGARFGYAVNDFVSPYIGAAYEHEFDAKARATTNGFAIDAPSLRGDTGIGEIGLTFKPSQDLPVSFDLGVQGYVGKREGITGSLQVKFEF